MSLYDKKEIMDRFIHNNIFGKLKDEVTVNICTFKYLCGLNTINIDNEFISEFKLQYGINIISSNKLENVISYGVEDSKSDFIEFNIPEDKPNKSKNKRNIEVSIKSTLTHSSFDKNKTSINSRHSIICDNIKIDKNKYYYIIIVYNGLPYGAPYVRVFDNNPSLDKSYKGEYKCYNFTIEEWESDILYLIRKQEYNTKLRDLQDKAEKLKKYYSDDRQADIAVNDILDSL